MVRFPRERGCYGGPSTLAACEARLSRDTLPKPGTDWFPGFVVLMYFAGSQAKILEMIALNDIRSFADAVARKFKPSKIILFGSQAYGKPNRDSDVDILVVMRHRGSPAAVATRIRTACPRSFPMDLMVRSPAQLRRRLAMEDDFFRDVVSKGIVLYKADRV